MLCALSALPARLQEVLQGRLADALKSQQDAQERHHAKLRELARRCVCVCEGRKAAADSHAPAAQWQPCACGVLKHASDADRPATTG
jgi:hypothetical protein